MNTSKLDDYIFMFQRKYETIEKNRKRAKIYLFSSFIVFWGLIVIYQTLISGYTTGTDIAFAAVVIAFVLVAIAVVMALFHYTRTISRIPLGGNLTYSLCQLYEGINEILKVKGGKEPLVKEKRRELLLKVVTGPIKILKSMIARRKSESPRYLLFREKEISLLERTKKSLETQVYPNIKEGNENQTRKYLGPFIKILIDVNFEKYEEALSQLEKRLPKMEVEIPEMRTYADTLDDLRRDLRDLWIRNTFFRFLILCPVIGAVFYLASFLIKIEAGVALTTTVLAAAALAVKTGA